MGTIKTTNIEPIADNGTVTLGSSGDQFTLATGAKSSFLYPAFEAYLSADQSVSSDTDTKVQANTEIFDTDNCYDNSTNYRFTPTVAGKYFVYCNVTGHSNAQSSLNLTKGIIYKNGSVYKTQIIQFANNYGRRASVDVNAIIDFNGSSDYVELFGNVKSTGASVNFEGNGTFDKATYLGAYRIGS